MESAKEREEWEAPCVNKIFVLIAPSGKYAIFKQRVNCTHQKICCLHAALYTCGRAYATKEETKGQFVATSSIALEFLLFKRWFSSALTHQIPLFFFYKSS